MTQPAQHGGVRRGRPRAYDESTLLAAARGLFWEHGYAGVSLSEIARVTGVHKPSLYAGFGDKAGLFRATVAGYQAESAALISRAFAAPRLRDAVAAFLRADIALFAPNSRGCYVIGIAVAAGVEDEATRGLADGAMTSLGSAVRARVGAASRDEMPVAVPAALMVDLIVATHITLAVRARAGESRAELHARARRFTVLFDGD